MLTGSRSPGGGEEAAIPREAKEADHRLEARQVWMSRWLSFPIPDSEGDKYMGPTLLQSKVAAFLKSKLNIHPWERNPFTPAFLLQLPYKMQLRKLQATYSKKKKKVISQRPGLSWE